MLKRHRCRLIFISFFVFMISIVHLGCAQHDPEQSGVEYVVWPGVTVEAKTNAEFAIDKTIDFVQLTYGVNLKRHIKVILVPDDSTYKIAIMQETGVGELEAIRRVRTTVAWSSGHTIIRNTTKANEKLNAVFKMSHELVHQYQEQETGGAGMQIEWFTEGMADIIAANVIDRAQLMPITQFKLIAQSTIGTAESIPSLGELNSPVSWNKALATYGIAVTYRTADMGVLFLTEKQGLPSLMEFLRELRKTGVIEDAFQKNFGVDIKNFEQQCTDYQHSLTKKAG